MITLWCTLGTSVNVPLPSPELLSYTRDEIGSMVTFNMASMCPNCTGNGFCVTVGGCKGYLPPRDVFQPELLDTDQWAGSLSDFGATYSVLVAQHCSGFSMFPTNEAVYKATGFNYTYSVDFTPWGNGKRDLVKEFVDSCRKRGIKPAFYYSLNHNYYLNVANGKVNFSWPLIPGQVNVDQDTYNKIVVTQYGQLLSQYGDLAEVWFDGGMLHIPGMVDLVTKYQPKAVYVNGIGPRNDVRWIGTEAGTPSYPVWSTNSKVGVPGAGDPMGSIFNPAETDTTFYEIDHWFWSNDTNLFKIRTMERLKQIYHDSVGQNSNLLMNFAPNSSGLIPQDHVERYKEFGDWVKSCYKSAPVVSVSNGAVGVSNFTLPPLPASIDRFVIREDQSIGQRVLEYEITNAKTGEAICNGTAVGNKRIQLLARPVPIGTILNLRITKSRAPPSIMLWAAHSSCETMATSVPHNGSAIGVEPTANGIETGVFV